VHEAKLDAVEADLDACEQVPSRLSEQRERERERERERDSSRKIKFTSFLIESILLKIYDIHWKINIERGTDFVLQ
jgi:hypothetical protein